MISCPMPLRGIHSDTHVKGKLCCQVQDLMYGHKALNIQEKENISKILLAFRQPKYFMPMSDI